MRIQGKVIQGPAVETIVIPRGDDEPLVFKAQAVLDYDEFEKLCPEPKPPMITRPGGVSEADVNDKNYQAAIQARLKRQTNFMFIKSLLATPGLTFDKIDVKRPETWDHFEEELRDAGLSQVERNHIIRGILAANCLDEKKIEEARRRFTLSQEAVSTKS